VVVSSNRWKSRYESLELKLCVSVLDCPLGVMDGWVIKWIHVWTMFGQFGWQFGGSPFLSVKTYSTCYTNSAWLSEL